MAFDDGLQFNRNYSLAIGAASPIHFGRLIDNLRVTFDISKSLEQFPNTATFDVYNLSFNSRKQLEETVRDVAKEPRDRGIIVPSLQFQAGYRDNIKNIFTGNITSLTTRKEGPDIVTTFEAGDGIAPFKDTKLDISFKPGATAAEIVNEILISMGLTNGAIVGFNPADQYLQGLTLTGSAKDHLTKVLKKQGLEWSIQDNQVQILKPRETTPDTALILNRASGLIGTPFRTQYLSNGPTDTKSSKDFAAGVHATALLNPDIRPGRVILLSNSISVSSTSIKTSKTIYDLFRVVKLRHYGDTHGNPWYTDIIAE
jgi:hypothetical protein